MIAIRTFVFTSRILLQTKSYVLMKSVSGINFYYVYSTDTNMVKLPEEIIEFLQVLEIK